MLLVAFSRWIRCVYDRGCLHQVGNRPASCTASLCVPSELSRRCNCVLYHLKHCHLYIIIIIIIIITFVSEYLSIFNCKCWSSNSYLRTRWQIFHQVLNDIAALFNSFVSQISGYYFHRSHSTIPRQWRNQNDHRSWRGQMPISKYFFALCVCVTQVLAWCLMCAYIYIYKDHPTLYIILIIVRQ